MKKIGFSKLAAISITTFLVIAELAMAGDVRLLPGEKSPLPIKEGSNRISQRGYNSHVNRPFWRAKDRAKAWSLPSEAMAPDQVIDLHILVLRFNFQYETVDDPNTTGRGHMNLAPHPLPDSSNNATPADSAAYLDSVGHFIDPPPHDSVYFDAHMQALRRYWAAVSEGHLNLSWDIWPPSRDSIYQLPHEMGWYGKCDSVIVGLERYFEDCIRLVDTVQVLDPAHPDIDFSQYDAIILFHAGSDRQNDIGFPETCSDLFTGFIRFGRPIPVDHGARTVNTALMMPETSSQDNRATALNAVMAHEFGHNLGLVDLYNTSNFLSQLGDFALMDNNGFGTGIDFAGYTVGRSFGVIPLYPMAWSRAFLGFVPVHDFREGTDIGIVAAEMASNDSIKLARIPISETQYYLIENRQVETNGIVTNAAADRTTNVIQGPAYRLRPQDTISYSREYDFLMPGSGLAVFLIDEEVAAGDFDGDGYNNFYDNQLQLDKDRKFITLVEADGIVNFGGNYRSGFGEPEDLFRDDRATEFTSNSNPPTVDNIGNDSHIFITDITRDTVTPPGSTVAVFVDSLFTFDLAIDKRIGRFPVRAGEPELGLSPIAADLNGDGNQEVLIPSGKVLSVVTSEGENYLTHESGCDSCPGYTDSVNSSVNPRREPVPIFAQFPQMITAGPVCGQYSGFGKLVAVGFPVPSGSPAGRVMLFSPEDIDLDGRADDLGLPISTQGVPIAMSFTDTLWILTSTGRVYRRTGAFDVSPPIRIDHSDYHGICRMGNELIVLSEQSQTTWLNVISDTVYSFDLGDKYELGPVLVDLDRNNSPEVITFSTAGVAMIISVDTTAAEPQFSIYSNASTGYELTVNPVVGDIDLDGRVDIVVGGLGRIYAFNHELTLKTDFPIQISSRYADDRPVAAPIIGDVDNDGRTDVIFTSLIGSVHSLGPDATLGFPVNAPSVNFTSRELTVGSPILFQDSTGGKLGYLAADGWFYAWGVNLDTDGSLWPMAGHDASGSFALDVNELGGPQEYDDKLPSNRFFAWPNPVRDGEANIRYFLGEPATRVTLTLYDLSGTLITSLNGPLSGGVDNEIVWHCADVTPGVYRCLIEAEFGNGSAIDFTDIAVLK